MRKTQNRDAFSYRWKLDFELMTQLLLRIEAKEHAAGAHAGISLHLQPIYLFCLFTGHFTGRFTVKYETPRIFTKTGSGQTWEEVEKQDTRGLQAGRPAPSSWERCSRMIFKVGCNTTVLGSFMHKRKRHFCLFDPLCINAIVLPRQARDKHRGIAEQLSIFAGTCDKVFRSADAAGFTEYEQVREFERISFAVPFYTKNDHRFTKAGSGPT